MKLVWKTCYHLRKEAAILQCSLNCEYFYGYIAYWLTLGWFLLPSVGLDTSRTDSEASIVVLYVVLYV